MSTKRSRVHPKYKTQYRVSNWPEYGGTPVTPWVQYGRCLGLRRFEEARKLLENGRRILLKTIGPREKETIAVTRAVIDLYDALGLADEAGQLRAVLSDP